MLPTLLLLLAAQAAPDTTRYVVLNHGRPAGEMVLIAGDGSIDVRYAHIDRNRGRWHHSVYRLSPAGDVIGFESRPLSRDGEPGDVVERLELTGDSLRYTNGRRNDVRARDAHTLASPGNWLPFDNARIAAALLRRPGQRARLLPGDTVRAEIIADTTLTTQRGPERVRYVLLRGNGMGAGRGVWLDAQDRLFASEVGWFITVRPDATSALPALRAIELRHREAQADTLARQLLQPIEPILAIRNGAVFDTETGRVLPRHTVIVRDGRIIEVGPSSRVAVPRGARVIDATGRTVMPGMWEMHGHLLHTSQIGPAINQLASGITTVRDLAADIDVAVSQRERADDHRIVAPRLVLGGFIEGPGEWAGPTEVIVHTEEEARAWVARYDSLGYRQIKLYNLVHPDLVPVIAREARARGLRLSGHVPRGLSVETAVRLGFDEINHAAFLFSTFHQDSLYVPHMRPYSAVAGIVAPSIDVDGPEMTRLIETLRTHRTVIDGTFNLWMGGRERLEGRGDSAGAAYAKLLKRLHDAGVPVVPGTDNIASASYRTELELYEHSGIPAPDVLRLATIVSARVMGQDAEYGSITPGKVADIVVVNGRPAERIADLEHVETVIRAGRVYSAEALRAALR